MIFKHNRDVVNLLIIFIISIIVSVKCTNLKEELNITQNQRYAIAKLCNAVLQYITESFMKDDLHLVRWLRATQFNIDEAKRLILEDIKWRKKKNIGNILNEDYTDVLEDYPVIYTLDKQGQPTYIAFAGEWDIRNAVVIGRAPRVIGFMVQITEAARAQVRELQLQGKNVTRTNLIISLEGFNLVQHSCPQCLVRIIEFLLIADNHYPGITDRIWFLNAPTTVAATLDLIKHAASPDTRKRMKVFGNDRNVWLKAMHSFISPENLSYEFGGTKSREVFQNPLHSKKS